MFNQFRRSSKKAMSIGTMEMTKKDREILVSALTMTVDELAMLGSPSSILKEYESALRKVQKVEVAV